MRRVGAGLLLLGLALGVGSCVVFPSQFGSDYAAMNGAGLLGSLLGWLLAIIGAGILLGGKGGPSSW